MRSLYGPLYFLTSQSEQLFDLTRRISAEYDSHFGQRWSEDPRTQERLKEQTTATIELGNQYVRQAARNNREILKLLRNNWHLVDSDDIPTFSQFQLDYARFVTEIKAGLVKDIPFRIHTSLGTISYLRSEMIEGVKNAAMDKQERLRRLSGPSGGRKAIVRRRPSA